MHAIFSSVCGRKQRQLLQSEHTGSATERTKSPNVVLHRKRLHLRHLSRRDQSRAGTKSSMVATWSRHRIKSIYNPTPTFSYLGKLTGQQATRVSRQCSATGPEMSAVNSQLPRSKHANTTPSKPPSQSPLEGIVDRVENLPAEVRKELTRHHLSTTSSLWAAEARPRGVLRTVILSLSEYGSAAYEDKRGKPYR
jgi:hypothetical protein